MLPAYPNGWPGAPGDDLTVPRTSRSVPSMQLAFALPRLLLDLLLVLLLVLIGRTGDRGALASIDLQG